MSMKDSIGRPIDISINVVVLGWPILFLNCSIRKSSFKRRFRLTDNFVLLFCRIKIVTTSVLFHAISWEFCCAIGEVSGCCCYWCRFGCGCMAIPGRKLAKTCAAFCCQIIFSPFFGSMSIISLALLALAFNFCTLVAVVAVVKSTDDGDNCKWTSSSFKTVKTNKLQLLQ